MTRILQSFLLIVIFCEVTASAYETSSFSSILTQQQPQFKLM